MVGSTDTDVAKDAKKNIDYILSLLMHSITFIDKLINDADYFFNIH